MSSLESRTPAQAAPTPVFSYAQAAKGRTTGASSSQISQATSGISTPAKESESPMIAATPSIDGASGPEVIEKLVNGTHDPVTKADPLGLGLDSESRASTLISPGSAPASPSLGTASTATLPKEDDPNTPQTESVWDRNTNGADKLADADARRAKKGKKTKGSDKESEKESEEEKKPELLVAAPPPTVNIWQQRREAQALKVKPSPPVGAQAFDTPNTNDATKLADLKKRAKAGPDDGEKTLSALPNGTAKDPASKSKKGPDGLSKGKEDASKRAAPRGSRVAEREEKAAASQLPPPVEDAISWPAPETAVAEEKRREKEKLEKEKEDRDETTSNKPRPKEKWVTVPYVPSVNFSTPLPTRGGRGRGGGRGGRDNTGRGATGDKANPSTTTGPSDVETRGRGASTTSRAASLPPTKRSSTDARAVGKFPPATNADRPKVGQAADGRRTSIEPFDNHVDPLSRGFHADQADENAARSGAVDQKDLSRGPEQGPNFKENLGRERADGRADRGRGGYRGRGGHNGFPNGQQHPQHAFTNGHAPQQPNGFAVRQNSGPFSPSIPPANFGNQFAQSPRGGRAGPRSQSIPNAAVFGRFPNVGPQPLGMLQTPGMYDYQPVQAMSAGPFQQYVDQFSVLAMVSMQLEYYFSIDNLCKDVYMRKHMDSQGFVFLTFIAGFKRIQALTKDLDMLRFACHESEAIDIIRGEDGVDRIRRKEGWEKWVLAIEERDESVRNAGPSFHHRQQPRSQQMGQMMLQSPHTMSPAFSPTGDAGFRPFTNGAPIPHVNGNGNAYPPETPLSAAVPDFAPAALPVNGAVDPLEGETTFYDEDVANLKLVFTSPATPRESEFSQGSYRDASSRTFSNGSIEGRYVVEDAQDERQGRGLTNGSHASEASTDDVRRSRSPFTQFTTPKSTASNGPPVMWVKGQRQQAPIPQGNDDELYTTVRARALASREASAPGETKPDMKVLYQFWSHFLCRNFNPKMYSEFRQYAIEDAREHAVDGMKSLISYYDEVLISKKKVIPDVLALHYVELVNDERANAQPGADRPAFAKLRLAWRNGALDLKSRKKIDNLVDLKLREELER